MSADEVDNAPIEARAALLIKADTSGDAAAIFERVKDLSPDDFDRFKNAYGSLFDILLAGLFPYIREAAAGLSKLWDEANAAFAAGEMGPTRNPDIVVSWGTRLRGAVLSVCNSITHHQERMYDDVCEKFGKGSPEHEQFKALFNSLYDDNFGYRYLYRLRNVMVHFTMMAVSLEANAAINEEGSPIAMWDINMDRSAVIESGKISAALKDELSAKPGDPSILQMLFEAIVDLRDANRTMLQILNPEMSSFCDTIIEFDELFDGETGVRGLIHQQSPELRAPFTTGFNAFAGQIIDFAYQTRRGAHRASADRPETTRRRK